MAATDENLKEHERAIIEGFFREKVPGVLKSSDGFEAESGSGCTEASCRTFAKALLGTEDIVAVENQGTNSFTLICQSQAVIVQFRLVPLDTGVIDLAHKIHGDLVPQVQFNGDFPLPVYTSKVIPGRVHIHQPFLKDADFPLQREIVTVTELGHFVAMSAWYDMTEDPVHSSLADSSWTVTAHDTFRRLLNNDTLKALAPELVEVIARIQPQLHLLDSLPAVLTHHDFALVNILVDDEGHVTGVIDFEEARTEAFGTCIWGLYECFFGSMEEGKWVFYDMPTPHGSSGQSVREVLEAAFWDSLWNNTPPTLKRQDAAGAVRVALSVGIIRRYLIRGMLDEIDMTLKVHQLSLEYARGILPQVWKGCQ